MIHSQPHLFLYKLLSSVKFLKCRNCWMDLLWTLVLAMYADICTSFHPVLSITHSSNYTWNSNRLLSYMGTAVAQWLRCCATNRKVFGSIQAVTGFFIDIKSFRSHYGPGVDSASNRNEYQQYFLGGKGGRCVRLTTYHHPVPLSRNLGALTSWSPLGLSKPVMGLIYFFTVVDKFES
jgi:hypothetical protein